ncbi:MAG TPA: DUF4190 domain-containing protein [Acidimicrobiia bacterium]|nr:DUF4190 domain-containing protein [Acidimicrobiia bacterium]
MTQPPPAFPSEHGAYPEPSQATTVLVLGILAVLFQILGPVAWIMGNKELAAIDAGRRSPENRGSAKVGKVIGIIMTVVLVLTVAFVTLFRLTF